MENTNETVNGSMEEGIGKDKPTDTMQLLNKFCWPGFIMPHIWGLGNGLVVGAIAFVPLLAPVMAFVFGFGGYQMAYDKSRHNKIIFYDLQVKWHKASIIYAGIIVALLVTIGLNGTVNYISNKNEIVRIVKEFEEEKERTVEDIKILLNEKYLRTYIGDMEYALDGDMEVNDDGQLWHLKNSYGYDELARRLLTFEKPKMLSVYQYYAMEEGGKIEIFFSIDEDFQITESKYYLYSPEEVYLMEEGPGLLIDGDRWVQYMDCDTMEAILRE